MAELTIRLTTDPHTGKKNVVISYHSDEDALPMEHEDEHRRLVNQLIEGGALSAAEVGTITIERERGAETPVDTATPEAAVERRSVARET